MRIPFLSPVIFTPSDLISCVASRRPSAHPRGRDRHLCGTRTTNMYSVLDFAACSLPCSVDASTFYFPPTIECRFYVEDFCLVMDPATLFRYSHFAPRIYNDFFVARRHGTFCARPLVRLTRHSLDKVMDDERRTCCPTSSSWPSTFFFLSSFETQEMTMNAVLLSCFVSGWRLSSRVFPRRARKEFALLLLNVQPWPLLIASGFFRPPLA